MDNYSLSDLAAVTGGNGVFGGAGGSWLIIILLFFMMGGGAWNRGDYGNYATAASQQEILFGQRFGDLDNKIDRGFTSIGNGISDATYALNNTIVNEGRTAQTAISQNRFDMANYRGEILAAIKADGELTRAMIQQNKIDSLQGRVNQLEMQNAMCGVVKYPNSMAYNAGASPFCGCNNSCN